MPFWSLFRKPTLNVSACKRYEAQIRLAAIARLELSKPLQPRNCDSVGELLAYLWQEEPVALLLVRAGLIQVARDSQPMFETISQHNDLMKIASMPHPVAATCIEGHFIKELQGFTRRQTPVCPDGSEARYDAVVVGLRACLRHNMKELLQTDEIFPLDYVFDCLEIGDNLRAHSLHDVHCEMLVTTKQIINAKPDGSRAARLQSLQRELYSSLRWLAHKKPLLWQMLKDPATSEVFWPVIDAIGNNRSVNCVPQLLDALSYVSNTGKIHIIAALNRIGEASALPALQALARENTWPVAAVAAKAVTAILRRSKGDAAQLLRAADTPQAANPGATLLRPVEADASPTRPEELLRPDLTPGPSPGRATR